MDGSKNENSRIKFCGCWLTTQNENMIMPNLQILFLQMLTSPTVESTKILSCENFPLYSNINEY